MSDLYVYLIRSRNKDNKDVPNFKERAKTILEYKENEDKVIKEFHRFAADGVPGILQRSLISDKCGYRWRINKYD